MQGLRRCSSLVLRMVAPVPLETICNLVCRIIIEEPFSILPIDKIAGRLRADIEEMIENNQSELCTLHPLHVPSKKCLAVKHCVWPDQAGSCPRLDRLCRGCIEAVASLPMLWSSCVPFNSRHTRMSSPLHHKTWNVLPKYSQSTCQGTKES